MTGIAIYMEGGGDRSGSRAALRLGMNRFLGTLKKAARAKQIHWKLIACGSRDDAFRGFRNAIKTDPGALNLLLVDAERGVTGTPKAHLRARDGWDLSFATEPTVHLMVQTMETWIVADPEALRAYYGRDFAKNKLPRRVKLEDESKKQVSAALQEATRLTQKREYHKIWHASELLRRIDPAKVRARCPHCERLFQHLDEAIEAA